jgi:hypothetical protein
MNQNEYKVELAKRQKVVNILQKRLDMAIRDLNTIYNKRAKTIQETLGLDVTKKYSFIYRIPELNVNKTKNGFFSSVEYSPKHENFVIRLKGIKKNGTASKTSEPINEAILITDIVNYSEME